MLHLIAGLLFFLLSPGVLLTIPAGSKGLFASGQTSVLAAAVHAVVFIAAIYLLSVSVEGFFGSQAECTECSMKCGARRNRNENCNVTCKTECTETAPAPAPAPAPAEKKCYTISTNDAVKKYNCSIFQAFKQPLPSTCC